MKDWIKNVKFDHVIALLTIVCIFAILFYVVVTFHDKPEIIFGVVGSVTGSLQLILGFFYGSTKSSQKKDEVIHKAIDNQNNNQTT